MTFKQLFCWHDYVIFRKAEVSQETIRVGHWEVWEWKYTFGDQILGRYRSPTDKYVDKVCSKCDKLKLRLKKDAERAKKRLVRKNRRLDREAARDKLEREYGTMLRCRRSDAQERALKYIDLADKA